MVAWYQDLVRPKGEKPRWRDKFSHIGDDQRWRRGAHQLCQLLLLFCDCEQLFLDMSAGVSIEEFLLDT